MLESNTSKLGQVLFWAAWGALSATEWVPWPACGCPTPHSHSRLLQQHLCGSVPKSQKFYSYKSDEMAEQQVILLMERMGVSHRATQGPRLQALRGLVDVMLLLVIQKVSRSLSSCRLNTHSRFQQGSVSKWRLSLQLPFYIMSWVLITQLLNVGTSTTPRGWQLWLKHMETLQQQDR